MKVIAVIVTYNRLELLKKFLSSVFEQSTTLDDIIVINNGSTDNTEDWLLTQPVTTYTKENNGGAGGFSYGINMAYIKGADWIWLMDDDTIPAIDALQRLLAALNRVPDYEKRIGFLSSNVLWTDGGIHQINRTWPIQDKSQLNNFSAVTEAGFQLIKWGTFVSMLLSAKAVERVGLPIKDFFIWCDDAEYSKRIIKSGLAGAAVKESVVVHETPSNHESSVFYDPQSAIWKYKYGLRNELYTKRVHDSELKFWLTWCHRMFVLPFRILLRRRNHRWSFMKVIWRSSINATFFHPTVHKIVRRNLAEGGAPVVDTIGQNIANQASPNSPLLK
jgi:rhamnopyranosyl-N-acetylglucosaminyl-diphospho-decaprenol beta-1,3/1,4-galactofuranosyltransferase